MRIFSTLLLAATVAVPLATVLPSSEAAAHMADRGSGTIGNYGYRDSSGFRSRGEGRNFGYSGRWDRGYGYNNWNHGHGRRDRGYGYRDRGNYGYRSNSGYRPISYSYGSYGYQPYGYSSHRHSYRRSAGYSYGYAPIGFGYSPYGYSSYGYRPAVTVGFGFGGFTQPVRAYGYGTGYGYRTGYGYTNVHDDWD